MQELKWYQAGWKLGAEHYLNNLDNSDFTKTYITQVPVEYRSIFQSGYEAGFTTYGLTQCEKVPT